MVMKLQGISNKGIDRITKVIRKKAQNVVIKQEEYNEINDLYFNKFKPLVKFFEEIYNGLHNFDDMDQLTDALSIASEDFENIGKELRDIAANWYMDYRE